MAACYELACAELATAGYEHYEISNWALPGLASRHNLKYWRRQPYFGFGAGAHSFDGVRAGQMGTMPLPTWRLSRRGTCLSSKCGEVSRAEALDEEMFLGLRQLAGIDLARIEQQYGVDFAPRIANLRAQGLVECTGTWVGLRPRV